LAYKADSVTIVRVSFFNYREEIYVHEIKVVVHGAAEKRRFGDF